VNPLPLSALEPRSYDVPPTLPRHGRYVDNDRLSNFARGEVLIHYRSIASHYIEAPYQAAKAPDAIVDMLGEAIPFHEAIQRLAANDPSRAKRLGKPRVRGGLIDPRADWEEVCVAAMAGFELAKFAPGTRDLGWLIAQPSPLVEFNNWNDGRWGAVLPRANGKAEGRNALGRLATLIKERPEAIPTPIDEDRWAEIQVELIHALNRWT
jgi:predicted NAD-dependent protein-ADP-ribosyltransferase YbiA (DUF1768 family)